MNSYQGAQAETGDLFEIATVEDDLGQAFGEVTREAVDQEIGRVFIEASGKLHHQNVIVITGGVRFVVDHRCRGAILLEFRISPNRVQWMLAIMIR